MIFGKKGCNLGTRQVLAERKKLGQASFTPSGTRELGGKNPSTVPGEGQNRLVEPGGKGGVLLLSETKGPPGIKRRFPGEKRGSLKGKRRFFAKRVRSPGPSSEKEGARKKLIILGFRGGKANNRNCQALAPGI